MSEEGEAIARIEIDAQKQRLFNTIKEALDDMNLISRLPQLTLKRFSSIIEPHLGDDEIYFLKYMYVKYYNDKNVDPFLMDDRITYFFKILKDSKPVIEKLKKLKPIEPAILKVMRFVQHLESHFQTKLALNGVDDNEYQRKLRNTYHANQFYKERIEAFTRQQAEIQRDLGSILAKNTALLNDYKQKIEDITIKNNENIEMKQKRSLKMMSDATLKSEEKQQNLKEESEEIKTQYDNLLVTHVEAEKKLRAKRSKIEAQLHSWIGKFDQDIGDRHAELEELTKTFDDLDVEFQELTKKMDDQEPFYLKCMEEKEEEHNNIMNKAAIVYLYNRSARRIQRYWREYNKKLKRKV